MAIIIQQDAGKNFMEADKFLEDMEIIDHPSISSSVS